MFRAHVLIIIRMSKLHYTASDIIRPIGFYVGFYVYFCLYGSHNVWKNTDMNLKLGH